MTTTISGEPSPFTSANKTCSTWPNGARDEVVVREAGIGTSIDHHAVAANTSRLKPSFRRDYHRRCPRKDLAHDPSRLIRGERVRRRQQIPEAKQVCSPQKQTAVRQIRTQLNFWPEGSVELRSTEGLGRIGLEVVRGCMEPPVRASRIVRNLAYPVPPEVLIHAFGHGASLGVQNEQRDAC